MTFVPMRGSPCIGCFGDHEHGCFVDVEDWIMCVMVVLLLMLVLLML